MSKINPWSRLLLAGALLATLPVAGAQEGKQAPQTLDVEYAQIAERVPGFGGLYVDEQGTTHVYLKDMARAPEVQDLGKSVKVHQGEYDFRELLTWKEKLRQRLAQPGAVFLDIDEQRNRLVFGVERDFLGAFSGEIRSFLQEAQVPLQAVIVEAAEPIVPMELLTDKIRPIPGGVRIASSGGSCTLGVNALRHEVSPPVQGFITASHCTLTRSLVEGTVFFQNTNTAAADRIGVETVDPPFFTTGCPPGRMCRYSDAAFVAYDTPAPSAKGQVANPLVCGPLTGTLEINPGLPRLPVPGFTFTGRETFVKKVGATTGCTIGFVINTCIDVNVRLSSITMLCQDKAIGVARPGDSGSPIFRVQPDGPADGYLVGILWGTSRDPFTGLFTDTFFYSPWLLVQAEIGPLTTLERP